ncbi:MAG TPA: ABC transporter permease subunit [Ktedonobacterales bacterium]|nr:ABC transporter permease subunit [Ktedonobacterales bacterium]
MTMTMMDGFGVFLRKELREMARSNRLLVVAAVFLLLGIISPVTAKYTPELLKALGAGQDGVQIIIPTPTVADAIAQYIKNVAGTGIFVAILLPMGMVAREKERGTAAFVLTKPVSRAAFLGAKLVAMAALLGIGVLVAAVATYVYTAILFEPVTLGGFIGCTALILLSLVVYGLLTFLGSTIANSQLPAVGIGLAAWVVISLIGINPTAAQYTPAGLLDPASALARGTDPAHLLLSVLANLALCALLVALSWLIFRRQELTGAAT